MAIPSSVRQKEDAVILLVVPFSGRTLIGNKQMDDAIVGVWLFLLFCILAATSFIVNSPQVKVAQFPFIVSIQPLSFVVLVATVQGSKKIVVESKGWLAISLIKLLESK